MQGSPPPPHLLDWATRLDALGAAGLPCLFLIDFEMQEPRIWDEKAFDNSGIRFNFPGRTDDRIDDSRPDVALKAKHIPAERFEAAFKIVQRGLQRGDSFLTNLTFPTPIHLKGTLEDCFEQSQAKYRLLLPDRFVSFSPETFITIDAAGYIESRPMKGTAKDTAAGRRELLQSQKEIAEHATIVDLIRNDLSQVAKRVRVTDYRYLRPISTSRRGLVQTSSKIGGQLPDNWQEKLGTTLLPLLPAGSVSGAPKPATLDLIRAAEGEPRGYYCGIAGYFDGSTLDTCVLIRFIEKTDGGYAFRSGGGITARSNWREEYAELKSKIRIPRR